jgi:hypothetical protein
MGDEADKKVNPPSEPITMLFFGAGLIGLASLSRRLK